MLLSWLFWDRFCSPSSLGEFQLRPIIHALSQQVCWELLQNFLQHPTWQANSVLDKGAKCHTPGSRNKGEIKLSSLSACPSSWAKGIGSSSGFKQETSSSQTLLMEEGIEGGATSSSNLHIKMGVLWSSSAPVLSAAHPPLDSKPSHLLSVALSVALCSVSDVQCPQHLTVVWCFLLFWGAHHPDPK